MSLSDARTCLSHLERILASREFAASSRMSRFLRFAVTETLGDRCSRLKEYTIGIEVFDRPESFDPGTDPIVRVEARRLRSKLARYYETEGRNDKLLIDLPKGTYVVKICRRQGLESSSVGQRTVAVLPFLNLCTSADSTYFSDGLTWELIHRLTRIDGLRVVAWESSAQLRPGASGVATPDISAIAEKLKARAILTGSVRQAGNRLRIVSQLIDGPTGVYLWSESFDRQVEDIFAIQEEIAQAIAATLKVRLASRAGLDRAHAYKIDAYRLYLRGRMEWNERTESGLRRSIESFRGATEIDPEFALAYGGLADAFTLLAEYGLVAPGEVTQQAKAAALRALDIEPTLGEAHCSLALLLGLHEWKWAEAEEHYRRSLDLNPGYATSHHFLACDHLALLGRFEEAQGEIEIARQLDPLSSIICEGIPYLLMLQRRYEESAEEFKKLQRADPPFYKAYTSLGRTLIHMGHYADAVVQLEKGRAISGDQPSILGAMGQAYGLCGKREEARRLLGRLEKMATNRHVSSTSFALIHLGLGERGRALDWLERGADQRELNVTALGTHPAYDELRAEPRFNDLLRRIGLAG